LSKVALLAVALVACGHTRGARNADRTSESNLTCLADPSRSNHSERPRRDHCLKPPYTVEGDKVEGLTHIACGERGHVFLHEGTRTLTADEQVKILEAHRNEIHAFPGVHSSGFGSCCANDGACVHVELDLCTTKVADLARAFASWVDSDANIRLFVELSGVTGPRCDGKGKPCGPTPYTRTSLARAGYRCDDHRDPIAKELAWGKCAHDGECSVAGCGNQCVPWPESNLIGTCEGYTQMEDAPAFCGCVHGECSWFVQ
jgi:hypothetical protein